MNINVIEIMKNQNNFNWYFNNRNCVLLSVLLLLVVASIYMVKKSLHMIEREKYKEIWSKIVIQTAIIIIVGIGLNAAGMKLKFAINHMPILLFFSAILITAVIQVVECVRFYRNYREVIKRTNTILIGIIDCTVLLLAIMGRLEVIELVVAVMGKVTIQTINFFIDNFVGTQEKYEIGINSCEGDMPVAREEDLFNSRKRQVENLCQELNKFSGEPFAVAICGKWGSGKTSFINGLKEKLNQAEFVNVECGIEHDVKTLLKDISTQIQEIYKKNNVYTRKNGVIEKYFEKIGEFVKDAGYGAISKIISKFKIKDSSSYLENKEAMNKELEIFYRLTQKRIYFLVDDMDRIIDDKDRAVLFQVIRESVGLKNCITLFMIDYERMTSDCMSKEFLEKYVNHQFELCDVEFEEIVEKYKQSYFFDSFWDTKSEYIKERGKAAVEDIIKNGLMVLSNIQSKMSNIQESLNKADASKRDEKINREHLSCLADMEVRLLSRMKNPRKVKRYLDNIVKMLNVADIVWFQNKDFINNEYSNESWVDTIFEIAFLKVFLYEEYDEVIKAKSLYLFKKDNKNSYVVELIVKGFCSWYTTSRNKEKVVELVIYRLYALDINTEKSDHQKLIEELDNNKLQEENLSLYLNECLGINYNFARMKKILDYIETHTFVSQRNKCEAIANIMSFVSSNYDLNVQGMCENMQQLKVIIDDTRKDGIFNGKECNMIEHYINTLQTRLVFENSSLICSLLGVLHNTELNEYFKNNLNSISQLYETILKINESFPISRFDKADTELETIIKYFRRVEEIFSQKKFLYIKNEITYFLEKIKDMLKIFEIWVREEDEEPVQYYDSVNGKFNSIVLQSVDCLIKSLNEFESYILSHQEDIIPGNAFIELVFSIEIQDKNNVEYLGKNKRKVIMALCNIYILLDKNQAVSQAYSDRWKFCRIRLFRMKRNIKGYVAKTK